MVRKKELASRLFIAAFSFSAAIAVYCFARNDPPDFLVPLALTNSSLAAHTYLFGSAPSFFYTLAFGLGLGACASSRSSARFHCLAWIALCLLLEFSQSPSVSAQLSTWLAHIFPEPAWSLFSPYWSRGVFDPLDLIATISGGLLALALAMQIPAGKKNARQ